MKKKIITMFVMLLCAAGGANAQTEPVNVFFGDFKYEHKKKVRGSSLMKNILSVSKVALGAAVGQAPTSASVTTTKEVASDTAAVYASIKNAVNNHPRFRVYEGGDVAAHKSEGGIVVNAEILTIFRESERSTDPILNDGKAKVEFNIILTDALTGKQIDKVKLQSISHGTRYYYWANTSNPTEAENIVINEGVANATWKYLMGMYPVAVEVLDKGVVKESGKLKSIYIEIGQKQGAQPNWEFFIVKEGDLKERGKQDKIGRIRIDTVEGDDVSICRVKSGAEAIQAAIDAGEKLYAVTNVNDWAY